MASQVVVVKNPLANAGNVRDVGLIPVLGRFPGGGHGSPFQYACLENPHGQSSLVGYSSWGCKDSDTAEQLSTAQRDGTDEPICRAAVETQRVDLWTWWGRRRWDKWREEKGMTEDEMV